MVPRGLKHDREFFCSKLRPWRPKYESLQYGNGRTRCARSWRSVGRASAGSWTAGAPPHVLCMLRRHGYRHQSSVEARYRESTGHSFGIASHHFHHHNIIITIINIASLSSNSRQQYLSQQYPSPLSRYDTWTEEDDLSKEVQFFSDTWTFSPISKALPADAAICEYLGLSYLRFWGLNFNESISKSYFTPLGTACKFKIRPDSR